MKPALQIDFVSDVACPWCAVGLASLDIALAAVAADIDVAAVRFQPFELNPQMGPDGEDAAAHLARKYGRTPAQLDAARAAIRQRGAEVGFTFGRRERIHNTFDAHRLLHWAGLQGAPQQHALKAALLQAYHGDARDIGSHAVLADVAAAGLDAAQSADILRGDRFAADVRAAERHWQQLGIDSVPAVVINGRHLIQGGQPPAVFETALRDIAAA